jgi:hypothetical protein
MKAKPKSRWKKPNERYPKDQRPALERYSEQIGWFRGARVTRKS